MKRRASEVLYLIRNLDAIEQFAPSELYSGVSIVHGFPSPLPEELVDSATVLEWLADIRWDEVLISVRDRGEA